MLPSPADTRQGGLEMKPLALDEAGAISAFRHKVQHVSPSPADIASGWTSDETILRFLRARKFDVTSAGL